MNHLIISREYPPAPYPSGGIGTYVEHMSRLLVDQGETVHIIAQRWPGAPHTLETRMDGRLIVHRVSLDEPLAHAPAADADVLHALQRSAVPVQAFSWQVARLATALCDRAAIDVIEAQEYEAPLYHLLRRRREPGNATAKTPVVVHLHTPSEFLYEHNEWDLGRPEHRLLFLLEEYTIRAADALLCPSRFLARIAEPRYQLHPEAIDILPYPIGDAPVLSRTESTWEDGTICYVGRLEPRKGVKEWVAAAAKVAAEDASVRFVLIGADAVHWGTGMPSMLEVLLGAIPGRLRERFTFIGAVSRPEMSAHFQHARAAVVPSRFDNFPNTCIEAMASGLPVIVSPTGGMTEMVEDGKTGWVADGQDAGSLASALRRALSTPPADLAAMGSAAAQAIRVLCSNDVTVRRHIEFRQAVIEQGRNAVATRQAGHSIGDGLAGLEERIDHLSHVGAVQSPVHAAHTMTPLDILRASPSQKLALIRRAISDPHYVRLWIAWQMDRAIGRVRRGRSPTIDRWSNS